MTIKTLDISINIYIIDQYNLIVSIAQGLVAWQQSKIDLGYFMNWRLETVKMGTRMRGGGERSRIRWLCHRATAGGWIRGLLEQYVAG